MSSASVSRPSGRADPAAAPASDFQMGRVAVVRTNPGLTAFTRTPRPARSAATVRVMAFRAAFAEAYETIDDVVLRGEPLEMATTEPPASPRPRASAARMSARVGQVLSRNVSRSCSSLMVSNGNGCGAPPTVLTRRSIRPNASRARSVRSETAGSVSIDPVTATTSRPSERKADSADATRPSSRPLMTTEAPSRARRRAHDRPMLGSAVDPVTMATRPENRCPPADAAGSPRSARFRSVGPTVASSPTVCPVCQVMSENAPESTGPLAGGPPL